MPTQFDPCFLMISKEKVPWLNEKDDWPIGTRMLQIFANLGYDTNTIVHLMQLDKEDNIEEVVRSLCMLQDGRPMSCGNYLIADVMKDKNGKWKVYDSCQYTR